MIRNSIKSKIIITFCLILTVSLAVSGGVAYYYSANLLQTQFLKDETINLNRTARQMEFISEDIRRFAINIALDSSIQSYLKSNLPASYEKYSQIQKTRNLISALEVQRDYMFNIVLIKGEELLISQSQNKEGLDETNYKEILQGDWYGKLPLKDINSMFSSAYEIKLLRKVVKVMPYIVNVRDLSSPNRILGQLIINVNYDYLEDYIYSDSNISDGYFWIDRDGSYLFEKYSGQKEIERQEANALIGRTETGTLNSYKTGNGYLIVDKSMKNGWILASYLSSSKVYQKIESLIYFFLFYTMVILVVSALIILPIVFGITRPLSKLTRVMKQVSDGDMEVAIEVKGSDELRVLTDGFNKMLGSLRGYIRKTVEYEKEKRDIELNLLLAQINPHFIYNTLHTVIYMAGRTKNHDIVNMVKSFIAVLQDAVKISEEGLVSPLHQELEVVRQYINIQQYRYSNRFTVEWEVDEKLVECRIPRTILQPIVENALLHGILPENEMGRIIIRVEAAGEDLLITIEDNGVGMDEEVIEKILGNSEDAGSGGKMRKIGMPNVIKRIRYICGENYGFKIESRINEYTRFIIKLPQKLN